MPWIDVRMKARGSSTGTVGWFAAESTETDQAVVFLPASCGRHPDTAGARTTRGSSLTCGCSYAIIGTIIRFSGQEGSPTGKYKRSRQRERILELLQSTGRHPSADWIYNELRGEFPNLSMGTVYRNLTVLMEQGLINRIDFGSTFDRFDANTTRHYHFVCDRCGAIVDLELPVDDSLNDRVNDTTPFTVRRHRIEFYGICDRCRDSGGGS